jgi:hypothetical protein
MHSPPPPPNYEKEERQMNRRELNGSRHYPNFTCSQFCHATLCLMQKLTHLPQFIGDPLFDLGCLCFHLFGVLQS